LFLKNKKQLDNGSFHACFLSARKKVLDFLVKIYKMCKASVGTNVLDQGNYVGGAKEEHVKEDNETQVEEEWSSYPSPNPNNGNTQVLMKTPSHTIAYSEDLYDDEPILDEYFDVDYFHGKKYDSWVHNILLPPIGNKCQ
jgi:hypothetical protein